MSTRAKTAVTAANPYSELVASHVGFQYRRGAVSTAGVSSSEFPLPTAEPGSLSLSVTSLGVAGSGGSAASACVVRVGPRAAS
jgi:hypothetical protein